MVNNLSPAQRSYCMSRVKSKDTNLERNVCSELYKRGMRFRKNLNMLPGKPDIVFIKEKIAIFLDGDFWHGYRFPQWENSLKIFWRKKISETRRRDKKNFQKLRRKGWIVIRIWEHEIKSDFDMVINKIFKIKEDRAKYRL